ncbi:MAG: ribosome maturation factor RimP [Halanaerobiales bacterium]|nr:ribosome maturation factor RimP [Halanaerobiales bacterium]
MGKIADEVTGIAAPIVETQGLKLVDVEYIKEGSTWTLRIFIENPDGELKIEDCERISKILSDRLDKKDPIDESYLLEVSSPGLERPLNDLEDYEKHKGNLIKVKTYAPLNGTKEFIGKIIGIENNEVSLEREGKNKGVIKIPFTKIAHAHLTVDF